MSLPSANQPTKCKKRKATEHPPGGVPLSRVALALVGSKLLNDAWLCRPAKPAPERRMYSRATAAIALQLSQGEAPQST